MRETITFSIVIGTFNRQEKLAMCLAALAELDIPEALSCEAVVVDNNSTDGTKDVTEAAAAVSPFPVHYVFEPCQGLSFARNAGAAFASGNVIAFIDDDCFVDKGWLRSMTRAFETDAALGLVGGRVELYDKGDLPVATQTRRSDEAFSADGFFDFVIGCNLAVRRELIEAVGGFDVEFGPGCPVPAAEDWDFVYRAAQHGAKMLYRPDPIVYHAHGRRTEADRRHLSRNYIVGRGAFYLKHMARGDRHVTKLAYWELRNLVKSVGTKLIHLRRGSGDDFRCMFFLFAGAFLYVRTASVRDSSLRDQRAKREAGSLAQVT